MFRFLQKWYNKYNLQIITVINIFIWISSIALFYLIFIKLDPYNSFKFNNIYLSNYTYFEYIINKTDSIKESFGIFNQKKAYCTCFDKNNNLVNITTLNECNIFNCSEIIIDEKEVISHNLSIWKNNFISLNSNKYYYYQGINPETNECDYNNSYISCGFNEDIQSDFCVKNIDNCPLIYPTLKNKTIKMDSIYMKKY